MSEADKKADRETDAKASPDRDERGFFKPGCAPGPGRGHTREREQLEAISDLIDLIEATAKDQLRKAPDTDSKIKAAKIALKVLELKKPEESGPVLEPRVEKMMVLLSDLASRYSMKSGKPTSALEMIDILHFLCADCERLGGSADDWFEEVDTDD
jgi:hypothetical protein